jgi:hypothetical protein
MFPCAEEVEAMFRSVPLAFALSLLAAPSPDSALAAPAPFPRQHKPATLNRATLVGAWDANWGGVRCKITLANSGDYVCDWCGTRYVGSWALDRDGRVMITESCQPGEARSWQVYAIRLGRESLSGPIESGTRGVFVRLERPCRPLSATPLK